MNRIGGVDSLAATLGADRGMRVVSLDTDPEVHARLRSLVEEDPGFILVGASHEWTECEALLDMFVPELLVANMALVPPQFLENLSSSAFPILVGLRDTDREQASAEPYGCLPMPLDPVQVCNLLDQVRCEVCTRKACELSCLLQRYMACVARSEQYLAKVKIEDGDHTEMIELERILSFSADGNYVRVHTDKGAFAIRDTMTGINSKLDPSRFARVHRSFIVNLSQIRDVIGRDGSTTFVILNNGMEVPVGPNYRDNFSSATQVRNRLIA